MKRQQCVNCKNKKCQEENTMMNLKKKWSSLEYKIRILELENKLLDLQEENERLRNKCQK